jgi:bifunctional DNase/RNase
MIFKDKAKKRVLPVCLSPIDAGIAVSQSAIESDSSPHDLSWRILKTLGVRLEKCFFTTVKGHHQYVELKFSGHKELEKFEARADDAISFCLQAGCRFYASIEYIEKSRVLEGQMMVASVGRKPEVNPHPYLN